MRYSSLAVIVLVATVLAVAPASSQPAASDKTADMQSKDVAIYGEVQSVNAAAASMSVQYYDYDSDSEKTIEIAVDKDTKIENAATIGDVNKGDWVDVAYVPAEGRNLAKTISVEKEDVIEPAEGQASGAPAGDYE